MVYKSNFPLLDFITFFLSKLNIMIVIFFKLIFCLNMKHIFSYYSMKNNLRDISLHFHVIRLILSGEIVFFLERINSMQFVCQLLHMLVTHLHIVTNKSIWWILHWMIAFVVYLLITDGRVFPICVLCLAVHHFLKHFINERKGFWRSFRALVIQLWLLLKQLTLHRTLIFIFLRLNGRNLTL